MSVRPIMLEEIKEIMGRILGSRVMEWLNSEYNSEVKLALNAVLVANRNAALFTYGYTAQDMFGDEYQVKELNDLYALPKPANPGQLYDDLGNLLYNCISNGGTDFLPENYRDVIEGIRHQLARQMAHKLSGDQP
jgi:hypothetical protein